jgi:type IV pilus assembly protein PilC
MRRYRYKAVTENGMIQQNSLDVSSSQELKAYLHERGSSLISYSVEWSFLPPKKVKPWVLMDLCLHLEQFEKAAIPLKDSLETLAETQTHPLLKRALQQVLSDVESGTLFSKALAKHPSLFDPIFVGLMAAGEKTGHFSVVLQHLFQHLKWVDEVQSQTFKALRYPALMTLILLSVLFSLMTVLVPELISFMQAFAQDLPFSTRCLIAFSTFLSHHLGLLLCISLLWGGGFIGFFKFHPKRFLWKNKLLHSLPLVGPLQQKIELSRFCHLFALLIKSGIDVLHALQTARATLKEGRMVHALEDVERFIKEGLSLSTAFEKAGIFPPLVIHMMKIGEQTSALEKTLFHVKEYFDTMLKRQVEKNISLIEPLMILWVGALLAWIIYAFFLPLYNTLSILEV